MSNINPMYNNGMAKSNTPISDSMNRWKNPIYKAGYSNNNNNIGMGHPFEQEQLQQQQRYFNPDNNISIPSNFIPQQNSLPPNFMLNPIPNKIKNKKKLKKNVAVLKEDTNETVFVNYTVEEKKAAKRKVKHKPTLNISESNGATTIPTNLNISNKNNSSSPGKTSLTNGRSSIYGNNSSSPANNIQTQKIKIKDNVITINTTPHDENDANMDFSKIINLDKRYTEITPTTTRFYMSSSSTPASPAIGTPSSTFYANSYKNISAQRPSSAVMPGFTKYNSYNGVSPYAKRAVSTCNKNSVYKSSKDMGSLSTTTLSTTLENTSMDLYIPNSFQNSGVSSYLDNFNDIMDENSNEESYNSSFSRMHQGSISERFTDPDITAVFLPNDYINSYPDPLDKGAIMGIGMNNKKDGLINMDDISRTVTGTAIAFQTMTDGQSLNKSQFDNDNDSKIPTMNFTENINREISVDTGEAGSNFDDIDFSSIDAMFPQSQNPSPIKPEQLDDLLNILK